MWTRLLLVAALLLGSGAALTAQSITWQSNGQFMYAPTSIPINTTTTPGANNVAMAMLRFQGNGGSIYVGSITIDYLGTNAAHVTDIDVYYSENTIFQGGTETPWLAAGTQTFTSDPVTLDLDKTLEVDTSGWVCLYVVLDFANTAAASQGNVAGVNVTEIRYGTTPNYAGAGTQAVPPTTLSGTVPLQDYRTNLTPTGIAPLTPQDQGSEKVPVLKLQFSRQYNDVTPRINSIRLHKVGTASYDDLAAGGVVLYYDDGATPGTFEGDETAVPLGSGTLAASGYVTLGPGLNLDIDGTKTYFLAVNVAPDASFNPTTNTIGLEIEAAADVTFVDTVNEDDLKYSFEYLQSGYLISVPAQSGNTFDVQELILPDTTPPTVVATSPPNGGTIDELDSPVVIYFSEDVQGANLVGSYTFRDIDGANVPFGVTYSNAGGEYTATLQPTAPLDYETFYKVTVIAAAISDYATPTPNVMSPPNKEITFGTGLEFPVVTEPTVVRNRIVTGRADESEMVILIPTPPKGATEKVTVQVFTATGRLVRTFVKNVAYSTITDGRIRWDGTNDSGKDLGPGVYFVQVRTESYKRALKVMIVR